MNRTCGVSKIQIIPEQVSAQRQWREAYPGRQNKQIRKSGINRHRESDIWNGRVKNLSARYMIKFTSHPSIPGTSVTSSPRVKIGLTVIWKYGGSTKHNRTRPRKGHLRRNFTPIRTYKRKITALSEDHMCCACIINIYFQKVVHYATNGHRPILWSTLSSH